MYSIVEQQELFETTIGIGTDIVRQRNVHTKTKGGSHLALRPEFTAGVMRLYRTWYAKAKLNLLCFILLVHFLDMTNHNVDDMTVTPI